MITVLKSSFEEVLPIWRDQLWPGRQSVIESHSAINELGEIELAWMHSAAHFFKFEVENKIAAVGSGLLIEHRSMRMRGLWVDKNFRRSGLGSLMIETLFKEAQAGHAKFLWGLTREVMWPFYERNGFLEKLTIVRYEFGPHKICYKNC